MRTRSFAYAVMVICVLAAGQKVWAQNPPSVTSPLLSPDGTVVAFLSKTEDAVSVAVVPASGGASRTLAAFKASACLVAWFPDGKGLLILDGEGGIWRIQTERSDQTRRAQRVKSEQPLAHGADCALSPNGSILAILDESKLAFLDIPSLRQISAAEANAEGWRLGCWLDDDTLLALTGEGSLVRLQRNALGKVETIIKHESMLNSFISVAVEGKQGLLALTSDDMQLADPQNPTSIWVFSAGGAAKLSVIPNARQPVWTANGKLFFSRRADVMVTSDFASCRPLGTAESWAVSRDGAMLVVARRGMDGGGLYRIAIQGETPSTPAPLITAAAEPANTMKLSPGNPILRASFNTGESAAGRELGTREALCVRAAVPPKDDGILDDPVWTSAPVITDFRVSSLADTPAQHQTELRLAYDDTCLYVAARMIHPNAQAIKCLFGPKDRDGLVFRDESVELFFDPTHSHQRYVQIIFTAGGAIYDDRGEETVSESVDASGPALRLVARPSVRMDSEWNSHAEVVPSREENAWVVEARIPLADFGVQRVNEGEVWGFQSCRDEKASKSQNVWAPIKGSTFHAPREFGNLVFGKRVLALSGVEWGTARGRCRLRAGVQSHTAQPEDVTLRLLLMAAEGELQLAETQVKASTSAATPISLDYELPSGVLEGDLKLTAGWSDKVVLSRKDHFELGDPIQLRMRREILSTASETLDVILWLRYGAASLANAKLVVEAINLDRNARFQGEVAKIEGALARISLSPKVIGKGCGQVTVSLIDAGGTTLATASAPYEIIQDPFEQ